MTKWISVKNELPSDEKNNSIYIASVYSHDKHKSFVIPIIYMAGQWFDTNYEERLDMEYEVTHWMPLPSPPGENNE